MHISQRRLTESHEKTQQQSAPRKTRPASAAPLPGSLHPNLHLQRMLGNRRVAQLIQAKRLTPEGKILGLQRKLTVGAADDQFEQEADRVAHQVLHTSDAVAAHAMQRAMSPEEDQDQMLQTKPLAVSITPFMQRQMAPNEEPEDQEQLVQAKLLNETSREPLQRQPDIEDEETEPLQAQSAGAMSDSFEAGDDVETQLRQSQGRGSPLPDPVRAYMEPRFGVDFRQVRVHTGSDALQMNQAVGAQAFTHGSDIYFGEGHSPTHLELIAHELTHVVQQSGGVSLQTKRPHAPLPVNATLSLQRACVACAAGGPLCPSCATEDSPIQRKFDATSKIPAFTTERRSPISQTREPQTPVAQTILEPLATSLAETETGRGGTEKKDVKPPFAGVAGQALSPGHMHQPGSHRKRVIRRLAVQGAKSLSIQRDEEPSLWDQAASAVGSAASAVADAVMPEGLLDSARGAVDAAQEKAGAVAGLGDEAAANATSESQTVESQVQSSTASEIASNQQQGEEAAVESQTQADNIQGAVQSQMGAAEAVASSVSSVGAMMGPLLNPAAAVLDFSGVMTPGAGGPGMIAPIPADITNLGRDIGEGLQHGLAEGGTPGWDCDAAEIVAMAGNVGTALTKGAVTVGKRVLGEDRYNALVQFGEETIGKLEAAANQAKTLFKNAEDAAVAWWQENVTPYLNQIEAVGQAIGQKLEQLKQFVSERVNTALAWGAEQWERIKTTAVDVVSQGINNAKQFIEEKINWVRNLVSRFWDLLPDWLKTAITGAAAVVAGPAALALAAAQKAAAYIAAHKDEIMGGIRAAADAVVQGFSEQYAVVREALSAAGSTVKGWMNQAGQSIREAANAAYAAIDEATGGRLTAVRQAVADVGAKIKGEACAVLGETAGPCIEQFVPDPGAGGEGFGELTASGELAVVIEGVPVKVGAGAKVKITRSGQEYKVVISGEGSLGVSLKAAQDSGGGSSANVSLTVDLPTGGKWKAWEKLTGQTPPNAGPQTGSPPTTNTPGAPTPPQGTPANPPTAQPPATQQGKGQTPGTAPGGSSGPSAEVGAGLKGSVEMTYQFDASKDKTTCDGLGGMTALLASQGLAVALPMPFNALAGQLGQAAFADRLVSCKFSAAQYADVSIDLLSGDVGSLQFKLAGERGVELESERDLTTGEVTEKATLKTELGGSLAAQLAAGPISGLGGSAGLKGKSCTESGIFAC